MEGAGDGSLGVQKPKTLQIKEKMFVVCKLQCADVLSLSTCCLLTLSHVTGFVCPCLYIISVCCF